MQTSNKQTLGIRKLDKAQVLIYVIRKQCRAFWNFLIKMDYILNSLFLKDKKKYCNTDAK